MIRYYWCIQRFDKDYHHIHWHHCIELHHQNILICIRICKNQEDLCKKRTRHKEPINTHRYLRNRIQETQNLVCMYSHMILCKDSISRKNTTEKFNFWFEGEVFEIKFYPGLFLQILFDPHASKSSSHSSISSHCSTSLYL